MFDVKKNIYIDNIIPKQDLFYKTKRDLLEQDMT